MSELRSKCCENCHHWVEHWKFKGLGLCCHAPQGTTNFNQACPAYKPTEVEEAKEEGK